MRRSCVEFFGEMCEEIFRKRGIAKRFGDRVLHKWSSDAGHRSCSNALQTYFGFHLYAPSKTEFVFLAGKPLTNLSPRFRHEQTNGRNIFGGPGSFFFPFRFCRFQNCEMLPSTKRGDPKTPLWKTLSGIFPRSLNFFKRTTQNLYGHFPRDVPARDPPHYYIAILYQSLRQSLYKISPCTTYGMMPKFFCNTCVMGVVKRL